METKPGDLAEKKLVEFLVSLVNLPDQKDVGDVRRFKLRFATLYEQYMDHDLIRHWALRVEEEDACELSQEEQDWTYWLVPVRNAVRVIWENSDLRFRQWGIFWLLQKFLLVGDRRLADGPVLDDIEWFLGSSNPPSLFENALMLLLRKPKLSKICANPECATTKYFWASRPSQRYCSEPCAIPAKREAKNKWWAAHGPDWRRTRKAARRKAAHKSHLVRQKK